MKAAPTPVVVLEGNISPDLAKSAANFWPFASVVFVSTKRPKLDRWKHSPLKSAFDLLLPSLYSGRVYAIAFLSGDNQELNPATSFYQEISQPSNGQ